MGMNYILRFIASFWNKKLLNITKVIVWLVFKKNHLNFYLVKKKFKFF